jgi:SAM-dependent methyltransferase
MKRNYNEYYGTEDRGPTVQYPHQLIERLFGYAWKIEPSKRHVLDIGCGNCFYLDTLKNLGWEANGIDLEAAMCSKNVKVCDFEKKIPYADKSYDIIFTKSVIEHLRKPENLVAESWRLLKPGGKIIVIAPDWKVCWKSFYDDYTHHSPVTAASLKAILEIHGFNGVTSERFYQFPQAWDKPWTRPFYSFASRFTRARWIQYSRWPMILARGIK